MATLHEGLYTFLIMYTSAPFEFEYFKTSFSECQEKYFIIFSSVENCALDEVSEKTWKSRHVKKTIQ
jgi:hypothetical protein